MTNNFCTPREIIEFASKLSNEFKIDHLSRYDWLKIAKLSIPVYCKSSTTGYTIYNGLLCLLLAYKARNTIITHAYKARNTIITHAKAKTRSD